MTTPDFLTTIRDESARFRAALAECPDRPVPTCPDWSTDDLLWHLAEVQWFWGTIVSENVSEPDGLQHPQRPEGREATLAAFDDASRALQETLRDTPADEERWMWTVDASLHSAGYILRRQAHEALIHRVDAELTADIDVSAVDADLAADGIDEVVDVMYGRDHPLVTFAPTQDRVVELVATDADRRWVLQLGRETASIDGEEIDDANFRPAPNATVTATISGTAADLDLWLWNRPTHGDLARAGDQATLAAMDEVLAEGMQ
ncbi:MAG TPA: maleylpyruvate isomerase N-terminal domain-containing protein [Flexivirga sp.]|uniref:maleylpyruvate isomerase N-terminal domain-containing protein n=1 Tax=Flexivirga sp. TaxID=1962927 RepID=UPI002B56DAF1|nr:maleylpyruvate isomerase N-terminal domain-containing protein [Flexivirga sp.]HWC24090.1 maleylpyruvate isomerase N-terminal domain-containing protein [Flexivirga sp.]